MGGGEREKEDMMVRIISIVIITNVDIIIDIMNIRHMYIRMHT